MTAFAINATVPPEAATALAPKVKNAVATPMTTVAAIAAAAVVTSVEI
ncbi:hypothetical protein [Nocardia sp. NPDC057227]